MDRPLRIGILHYACPCGWGRGRGDQSACLHLLHRLGQSVSILAGMGEVYANSFPVRIEPLLGSKNEGILKAHDKSRNGDHKPFKRFTNLGRVILWSCLSFSG